MATGLRHRLLFLACLLQTTNSSNSCPSYHCGQSVDIRYPFWVADASGSTGASHCGYPSLGLECRGDTPVLRLPSGDYAVTRILYGDTIDGHRTLTLFDLGINSSTCPHELVGRNLTLPPGLPPPLSLTARNINFTFLLNCTFVGITAGHLIPCLQNGPNSSYYFRDRRIPYDYEELCQDVVGMPVLNPFDDVVPALKAGFELSWRPAAGDECAGCEKAGGMCGHRRDTFVCFSAATATPSAPWAASSVNNESNNDSKGT